MKKNILYSIINIFLIFAFFAFIFIREKGLLNFQIISFPDSLFHQIVIYITTIGLFSVIALIFLQIFVQKNYEILLLFFLTILFAIIFGNLLKIILQYERPELLPITSENPLIFIDKFSFPSIHAALIFSILPILKSIWSKKKFFLILFFAFIISFSRLYLQVHIFSEIMAGIIFGLFLGYNLNFLNLKYKFISQIFHHIKNKFELRRQILHILMGISIVTLYELRLINLNNLLMGLFVGVILILFSRKYKLPFIHTCLKYFEREKDLKNFPGKGSFFLLLSSILCIILFPENIALASILIMSFGDGFSNIVGNYFGKIKNPLNSRKHLEGLISSIVISSIVASFYVPFLPALLGSTISMIIESIDFKYQTHIIDDNILVPLIAGLVL